MSKDKKDDSKPPADRPKFELEVYRKFIREAAPYVSVILGRKLKASDATMMSDTELNRVALLIDARVKDLPKDGPK